MKVLQLIPLLLLTACSALNPPRLPDRLSDPAPTLNDGAIRYPEVVRAYYVGRYSDPNNGRLLHDRHTVYRVEAGSRWNFHPGEHDADSAKLPPMDAAFSLPPATDEIIAELNRQKQITEAVTVEASKLTGSLQQFGQALAELRASAPQDRKLREELADALKRIDALEAELRKRATVTIAPDEPLPEPKNDTEQ